MASTEIKTYTINTECGLLRDFAAASIEAAKAEYIRQFDFDFDGVSEYPGSWYWVSEDGVRVEGETENMP